MARRAAETMKITAPDLKALGVIDEIIPEVRGGAHRNVDEQAKAIDNVLKQSLKELLQLDGSALVEQRYQKFKQIGQFTFSRDYLKVQ